MSLTPEAIAVRLCDMSTPTNTFTPTTVAAFKRAMSPGTRVRIDNRIRPQASRDTVVLPKTNTVDLVTSHPSAPHGSHMSWPKKGMVAHDGDSTYGILRDDTGEVWITFEVLA